MCYFTLILKIIIPLLECRVYPSYLAKQGSRCNEASVWKDRCFIFREQCGREKILEKHQISGSEVLSFCSKEIRMLHMGIVRESCYLSHCLFFPSLITFCSNLFPSPRNSQFSNVFQFWFWIPFVKEYFDNPIVNTIICFERCKQRWVFVVCQRRY